MIGLLLLLLSALAAAGELEQIRVFAGNNHARVLVLYSGEPSAVRVQALPPIAGPARGIVLFEGIAPGGVAGFSVGSLGVLDVGVESVAGSAQLTVSTAEPRRTRATQLGPGAVVIDLVTEGQGADLNLPTDTQLRGWLEGVGLLGAAAQPAPRAHRLVVLDPGHGGWDHGAVGPNGAREADIALQIALRAAEGLREKLGVEVLLTRETDVFVPLGERAALANRSGADLFVSIHVNAAPGPAAAGVETYSLDTARDPAADRLARAENAAVGSAAGESELLFSRLVTAGASGLSQQLASEVQSQVVAGLQRTYGPDAVRDLGTKTALFYVLVSARMPAVLLETGFVSNPDEERKLRAPHYQQAIADSVVVAVEAWLARQP